MGDLLQSWVSSMFSLKTDAEDSNFRCTFLEKENDIEQRLAIGEGAAHRYLQAEQACAVRGTAGTWLEGSEPGGEQCERRELC